MSDRLYPHRHDLPYENLHRYRKCRCGHVARPEDDGENCIAAMKDHIADLSRHEASIHKAAARAVEAERAAVVEWLMREPTDNGDFEDPADLADAIARGDHIKEQA